MLMKTNLLSLQCLARVDAGGCLQQVNSTCCEPIKIRKGSEFALPWFPGSLNGRSWNPAKNKQRKMGYKDIGDKSTNIPPDINNWNGRKGDYYLSVYEKWQKKDYLHPTRYIVPLSAIGDSAREVVARSAPLNSDLFKSHQVIVST